MKSYSAYFVRSHDLETARSVLGTAEPIDGSPWLLCGLRNDAPPPKDEVLLGEAYLTLELSTRLGEVFFVYGDTSIDGFAYEHAVDGKLLRKLVWFPLLDDNWTPGWVFVEGEPETWEARLFRPDALERVLKTERQLLEDDAREPEVPECIAAIEAAWSMGEILAGKTFPPADGTVAMLIQEHYGITRGL